MRKIYITFGGSVYDGTTKRIVEDGPKLGADAVWVYDDLWITQQEFYRQNKWLWEHPHKRGFGWYAWKPFIIIDALSRMHDGDIVLFTDADTYPVKDLSVLFDTCTKEGAMFFEVTDASNLAYCKRDCYIVMGQDQEKYHTAQAAVARFMLFKKGDWRSNQLLMEWLSYSVNPLANTFDKSVLGKELDGFVEHRCEQAILTLLAHKYGYKLYREACQGGNAETKDKDIYGQLFVQENTWLQKNNNKNSTAPVEGSIYRNIPDRKEAPMTATPRRASGKRILGLKNYFTVDVRNAVAKRTPKGVKEFIKKIRQ